MARLIATEWIRSSRQRVNQVALLLLVLAACWHFWSDYRTAHSLHLLADHGADVWRWFRAGELVLALPDTFGLDYWIWAWARAAWLLLAAMAVGGEFQWGTLRWRLSLGPGRGCWLLATVSVLVLSALAATVLLWLVVAGSALCSTRCFSVCRPVRRCATGVISWPKRLGSPSLRREISHRFASPVWPAVRQPRSLTSIASCLIHPCS